MNWKDYEVEIFQAFTNIYPEATITFDAKIIGRFSKEERQIDVLVDACIAGRKNQIVVDGKFYNKKIDVKHVESFISMVHDIGADQGIIVTPKGYSKAAINRAYYGSSEIELDILNFDELLRFQGFGGITYSGKYGALLPSPFGWIVDGARTGFAIATLYQRGLTLEKAMKRGEWIYMNIFHYDKNIKNLDELIDYQEEATKSSNPLATFEYGDSVIRHDAQKTIIRKIIRVENPLHEYTGFVDFNTHCVFCVLLTPEELKKKNIRKLEYVIETLLPINVNIESVAETEIQTREELLERATSDQEKAEILISIGKIYRDMEDFDNAKRIYQKSIDIFPINYGARLALLEMDFDSINRDSLINSFFELDPTARQIHDNIVRLAIEHDAIDYIETFFLEKLDLYSEECEIIGSIYFSLGVLFYNSSDFLKSTNFFQKSKQQLEKCFDSKHPAFEILNSTLDDLSRRVNIQ